MSDFHQNGSGLIVSSDGVVSVNTGDSISINTEDVYIGIDFGTSTTVVSAARLLRDGSKEIKTLQIPQPTRLAPDGYISPIVNSVLSWEKKSDMDGVLFWGHQAYIEKQRKNDLGKSVFSSFKMSLGLNCGPTYPYTYLKNGKTKVVIETAKDAATEFFKRLKGGIEKAVNELVGGSDFRLQYSVSVPASFQVNQRKDLLESLKAAGINVKEESLIDEPNAAFLSYLYNCGNEPSCEELKKDLLSGAVNVLVYDFGAGTCDISILNLSAKGGRLSSRNLAISKFTALGGDNLDAEIAKQLLLPKILAGHEEDFLKIDVDEKILPRLLPVAEELKIAMSKRLRNLGIKSRDEAEEQDISIRSDSSVVLKGRDFNLELINPSITIEEYLEVLDPFIGSFDESSSESHVFTPVAEAIEKAEISKDELYGVIFIGGSAENPLVQSAVMENLDFETKILVPVDLRTHVSLGAALYSLVFNGCKQDIIQPITSEDIFIMTTGEHRSILIKSCTPVPSEQFVLTLTPSREGQDVIDLPVCSGSSAKILCLLQIKSPSFSGFTRDEKIQVKGEFNHNKLLSVSAQIGNQKVQSDLINPLANAMLSEKEKSLLIAKKELNIEILENRCTSSSWEKFGDAAKRCHDYQTAAESYIKAEKLDHSKNLATSIDYCYSLAGNHEQTKKWSEIAEKRNPSAVTAWNCYCSCAPEDEVDYLRKCLRRDPEYTSAQIALGKILYRKGQDEGTQLLNRAIKNLVERMEIDQLSNNEYSELIDVCTFLGGHSGIVRKAKERQSKLDLDEGLYDKNNLATDANSKALTLRY